MLPGTAPSNRYTTCLPPDWELTITRRAIRPGASAPTSSHQRANASAWQSKSSISTLPEIPPATTHRAFVWPLENHSATSVSVGRRVWNIFQVGTSGRLAFKSAGKTHRSAAR